MTPFLKRGLNMKKLIIPIILAIMLMASNLWAAGTVTQTVENYTGGIVRVLLSCTGDATDGSIPDTAIATATMNLLAGKYYLYSVKAKPTAGGTAPDAANVFVLMDGDDLLGSTDGGTTANKGANLIHATMTNITLPYSNFMSNYFCPTITGTITLRVAAQATVSANYQIELIFWR